MSKAKKKVCDSRCQEFHKEAVRKEERLKSVWFIKNRQRLYDDLEKDKSKQVKTFLQKLKRDHKPCIKFSKSLENVKQQILPSWRPATKDVEFDLMRPIEPSTRNILYAPKDASFISKKNYLKERYEQKPEDRYYYPACSSWVCGWRLKDYEPSVASKYGARSVIQSSFYRKNASSVQRDPDWYRMCQSSDPKNFNDLLTY